MITNSFSICIVFPSQNSFSTEKAEKQQIILDSTLKKIKQSGERIKMGEKVEDSVPYPNSIYPTSLFPAKRILPLQHLRSCISACYQFGSNKLLQKFF